MIEEPQGRDVRRLAVGAGLAVALVLTGLWFLRPDDSGGRSGPDPAAAAALAGEHVAALVSLSARDTPAAIDRLEAQATGEWATQLAADPTAMVRALESGGVSARGHVDSTAVVAGPADSPRILVAASALVSNAAGAEDATRTYYFVVSTSRVGETWRVAGVEAAR